MERGFEVRQATLDDWPRIKAFIDQSYGPAAAYKQRDRWEWQFINTPYPEEAAGRVPVWIALSDDQVAGQIGVQPGQFFLTGEAHPFGWIVDVMVAPQFRGRGVAHSIHSAIQDSGRTLMTLTMAAATRRIAERAGALTLGPVRQMVRADRLSAATVSRLLEPIVERRPWLRTIEAVLRSRAAMALAASSANGASRLRRSLPRSGARLRIETVDCMNRSIADRLFDEQSSKISALCDRGGMFCQWRFDQVPTLRYSRALLFHDQEELRGQIVWRVPERTELNIGIITDILINPADALGMAALIQHSIESLTPETEAIVAGASHPAHVRALSRAGFVTVKTHHPTVVTSDETLRAKLRVLKDDWHFTKADHDWDQVHPI